MIVLIDNYDSFTYNLYQVFRKLGQEVVVFKHDEISVEEIEKMSPLLIVLSPGPGRPERAGICLEVVKKLYRKVPIFGVCLGHQVIAEAFGQKVLLANRLVHGKVEEMIHDGDEVFRGIENHFLATRYHSLIVKLEDSDDLIAICHSKDGEIMALKHKKYPIFGVQFHPESYGTIQGICLIRNFLKGVLRENT